MATAPEQVPREAIGRLLKAWRGEVEAGAIYELIARRETDERRAEILRRMAAAESGHRARIERRLTELCVPIPDPASVRPSLWMRLQARVAPVDRLLAAREAAEDDRRPARSTARRGAGCDAESARCRGIRELPSTPATPYRPRSPRD